MAAVVAIPMDDVAMVVPVPTGVEVRNHTGALVMGGEALADPDAENTALIVTGTLILTSPVQRVTYRQVIVIGPVTTVGYRRIVVAGQVLAPVDSQPMLGPAVIVKGQLIWYAGQPRFFVGKERFERSFFELQDRPLTLALVGSFEIGPDVPPALLREKVQEITLVGKLVAPRQLVGVLQLLTTENVGKITVAEDDSEPR